MSKLYDEYLREHITHVENAYLWLCAHFPDITENTAKTLAFRIINHDASKYSNEEYDAYDRYFYGMNRSNAVVKNFKYAWLHHIHNNPHHWQYWVLENDDEPEEVLEMPYEYIIEMICDWWSFSWKLGKLDSIFDWYEKHKDMQLGPKTRKTVESILEQIREELTKEDETDNVR